MNPIRLNNYSEFAQKAKFYASRFHPCAILDSCNISPQLNKGRFKLIIGYGGTTTIEPTGDRLESLYESWNGQRNWIFGVLGFDLKNEIEKLNSSNDFCFNWPRLSFFAPGHVITVSWDDELSIHGEDGAIVYDEISGIKIDTKAVNSVRIESDLNFDFDAAKHGEAVVGIKEEIRNGNVYELNLCSRFLYKGAFIKYPYHLFNELLKISPAPFSAYFSLNDRYILSASPERYMAKNKNTLISQPIKGTRPRGKDDHTDEFYRSELKTNIKDRAENVMIVDLVRNDLARVSVPGSVKVEELFGIYTYSHVHQMVSTVSSEMENRYNWKDAIKNSFPMGSMTGTPKIAALQWIEQFELSAREWYSGALGYVDPEGNMDFNVLIRSIFYDLSSEKLAYYAGGAITIDSDPDEEYHEMMVKAEAIDGLLKRYR